LQVESCGLQGSREKRETPLKNGFFGNFNHFVKYFVKYLYFLLVAFCFTTDSVVGSALTEA
jgi:hypothetical protein